MPLSQFSHMCPKKTLRMICYMDFWFGDTYQIVQKFLGSKKYNQNYARL